MFFINPRSVLAPIICPWYRRPWLKLDYEDFDDQIAVPEHDLTIIGQAVFGDQPITVAAHLDGNYIFCLEYLLHGDTSDVILWRPAGAFTDKASYEIAHLQMTSALALDFPREFAPACPMPSVLSSLRTAA